MGLLRGKTSQLCSTGRALVARVMRRFFENKSKLHREAPHERPPPRRVFREIKLGWRAPLEPSDAGEPARKGPRSWRGGSGAAMGGESAKIQRLPAAPCKVGAARLENLLCIGVNCSNFASHARQSVTSPGGAPMSKTHRDASSLSKERIRKALRRRRTFASLPPRVLHVGALRRASASGDALPNATTFCTTVLTRRVIDYQLLSAQCRVCGDGSLSRR